MKMMKRILLKIEGSVVGRGAFLFLEFDFNFIFAGIFYYVKSKKTKHLNLTHINKNKE